MKLVPVIAENFKMDGGACFGVVPKSIWQKHIPADENNMIPMVSRCLLVDTGQRLILIDTGMGDKQSEKFFSYFHLFGDDSIEKSFREAGYTFGQVTDVILTHLHFDHVGGALKYGEDGQTPETVFPNATYYCTKEQWDWALNPNPREKAAYFPENLLPLYDKGQLEFIHEPGTFCDGVELEIMHGHTRGQIVPVIDYKGRKLVFTADFIASVVNVPVPYVPSYDIDPLTAMKEKEAFLTRAAKDDYVLFFEHDYYNECCNLEETPKGVRVKDIFKFSEL
jgi:glyoxylase-like metal-dependent hydrolase (beta-lactamase superfamily II)